jgi:hypothetical protein
MEPSVLGWPPECVVGPVHGNVQNVHQLDHDPADVLLSPHSDYPLHLHIDTVEYLYRVPVGARANILFSQNIFCCDQDVTLSN